MKRKIIAILLTTVLVLSLIACGGGGSGSDASEKQEVKEYDIETFGKTYEETRALFDEETKYMTEEEINNEKGHDIWTKCSKQTGLPVNEEIILRGKKQQFSDLICIKSENEEYIIFCTFPDIPKQNVGIFVEDGSNVVVKGIFSKEGGSYGMLSDTTFVLPSSIDATYKDNVADALVEYADTYKSVIVHGEVELIQSLDEFEYAMDKLKFNYEHQDYYYDTVATLSGDGDGSVYFIYDSDKYKDLKVGDKIATQGTIETLLEFKSYEGEITPIIGLMVNVSIIYIFE